MAIAEYVNAQRIELFKKLLVETDLPVNQILVKVGYTNTDTSTRNFKKREGITPSEYRKLHKTR
jgi:YesN/AraC family two-component response regulator